MRWRSGGGTVPMELLISATREKDLAKGFGGRFINLDALEREFKSYAIQENGTANSD